MAAAHTWSRFSDEPVKQVFHSRANGESDGGQKKKKREIKATKTTTIVREKNVFEFCQANEKCFLSVELAWLVCARVPGSAF
jgi:hypothetical protein